MAVLDPVVCLILDESAARRHLQALRNETTSFMVTDPARAAEFRADADRIERSLIRSTSTSTGARR